MDPRIPMAQKTQNLTGGLQRPVDQSHTEVVSDTLVSTGPIGVPNQQPEKPADPWLGKPLGSYVIEKLLGAGGMGRVYRARHRWLENSVAVKVLNPNLDGNSEAIHRFHREAKIAASLNHPNIVRATDGGPINDSFFLATELIEGCDLSELVRTNGPLEIGAAAWLVEQAAVGLEHAHQAGLVHRDIKPSNIMLPVDGAPKLLDLGLARYSDSNTNLTSTGQFMGTLDFVSPEQATDTRGVDRRADIYSLGCTLYYLVTGQAPFEGDAYDTAVSKILAHAEEEPLPVNFLRKDVPQELVAIIDRAMAKLPDDRYQTAAEFAAALNELAVPDAVYSLQKQTAPDSKAATQVASSFLDRAESFSDSVLKSLWLVCRTLLLAFGVLLRVEVPNSSRISSRKKYNYELNPKAIFVLVILGGIALMFLSGMMGVEYVEPPFEVEYVEY